MGEMTKIQWCDDTHNFWRGCTKVSEGCAHCYAEKNVGIKMAGIEWGKGKPRVRSLSFDKPLVWNKKPWICEGCGEATDDAHLHAIGCNAAVHRRRVFALSLGDIGDPEVPLAWFNEAMVLVDKCRNLDFLLLTKRPTDFMERWTAVCNHWGRTDLDLPANIWMGVSVENQKAADERIPELLRIPAKVRFLSMEPLLGPVDLTRVKFDTYKSDKKHAENVLVDPISDHARECYGVLKEIQVPRVDWVIVGGESGAGARPCQVEWVRKVVGDCQAAKVAVFVKQLGGNVATTDPSWIEWKGCEPSDGDEIMVTLKDKKGGDMGEWPLDLKVRQFPKPI